MPRHEAAKWNRQLITASISFWVRLEICTWDLLSSRHTTPIKGNFTKIRTKLHRAENMFPPEVSDVPPPQSLHRYRVRTLQDLGCLSRSPREKGTRAGDEEGQSEGSVAWSSLRTQSRNALKSVVAQQSVKQADQLQ